MNRRFAVWTIVAVAALGLTACTADSPGPTEPSTAATEGAPASADASLTTACLEPSQKLLAAGAEMAAVSTAIAKGADADPQVTLDTLQTAIDSVGAAADAATNPEVKAALSAVHDDYVAFGDVLSRILIDGDYAAVADLAPLADDIRGSLAAFEDICAP